MSSSITTPTSFIDQAEDIARDELPSGLEQHAVFFKFASWPPDWESRSHSLPELKRAVSDSLGRGQSVFAFLRYHDFAHARRSSEFIEFASRQNDANEPLHVYWQVRRSGAVFQQAQQPEAAGEELSLQFAAEYVAGAVDFAGHFYQALGVGVDVTLQLRIAAPEGFRVRGLHHDTGNVPAYTPVHERRYRPQSLMENSADIAVDILGDLYFQCGVRELAQDALKALVAQDLNTIGARRRSVA